MNTHRFAIQVNRFLNVHAYFDIRYEEPMKVLHVFDLDQYATQSVTNCMGTEAMSNCLQDVLDREQQSLDTDDKWDLIDVTVYCYGTDGIVARYDLQNGTWHPVSEKRLLESGHQDWLDEMNKRKEKYK